MGQPYRQSLGRQIKRSPTKSWAGGESLPTHPLTLLREPHNTDNCYLQHTLQSTFHNPNCADSSIKYRQKQTIDICRHLRQAQKEGRGGLLYNSQRTEDHDEANVDEFDLSGIPQKSGTGRVDSSRQMLMTMICKASVSVFHRRLVPVG